MHNQLIEAEATDCQPKPQMAKAHCHREKACKILGSLIALAIVVEILLGFHFQFQFRPFSFLPSQSFEDDVIINSHLKDLGLSNRSKNCRRLPFTISATPGFTFPPFAQNRSKLLKLARLLKTIIILMDSNDIPYFLSYQSMLGAIRHMAQFNFSPSLF